MEYCVVKVLDDSFDLTMEPQLSDELSQLIDIYVEKRDSGAIKRLYFNTGFFKCDATNVVHMTALADYNNVKPDTIIIVWGEEKYFEKHFKCANGKKSIGELLKSINETPDKILERLK